jgi:hypothetical protein
MRCAIAGDIDYLVLEFGAGVTRGVAFVLYPSKRRVRNRDMIPSERGREIKNVSDDPSSLWQDLFTYSDIVGIYLDAGYLGPGSATHAALVIDRECETANAGAKVEDLMTGHFNREVRREALWGKERACQAVQVVSSFLPVRQDKEAFIERKTILLEQDTRLRVQRSLLLGESGHEKPLANYGRTKKSRLFGRLVVEKKDGLMRALIC